ncbi:protein IQ-DOMAIN 9 [Silene latifolia]|uniref:protein IQ-DOMAIN 9 n=1 Tax=Silene latifolia TaxID=37657 RepID=UPI003D78AC87
MGSGDWFKTIISKKKVKVDTPKQSKGSDNSAELKNKSRSQKKNANGKITSKSNGVLLKLSDDVAATRIQTAFRAYMARKSLRRMKGIVRFQKLTERKSVKKQSKSTLTHLHLWSRIQAEIRDRRLCMVTEGRLKQKKLENQLKLEAKLHDLEVEWNSGADTMDEILARIHLREEAAVKRERTMAYAFNHQWRANTGQNQGPFDCELGKANWGWSWKERWIAARPWETRVASQSITKKVNNKSTNKATKILVPSKSAKMNRKPSQKGRRVSYPGAEKSAKPAVRESESDSKLRRVTFKQPDLAS